MAKKKLEPPKKIYCIASKMFHGTGENDWEVELSRGFDHLDGAKDYLYEEGQELKKGSVEILTYLLSTPTEKKKAK